VTEQGPNRKAAIYARVSTKDKGQETENQLRQLREFAALQGWTVRRELRGSRNREERRSRRVSVHVQRRQPAPV
jgi:DNA invertase Pin-like site-specific DNA recombinase